MNSGKSFKILKPSLFPDANQEYYKLYHVAYSHPKSFDLDLKLLHSFSSNLTNPHYESNMRVTYGERIPNYP